MSRKIKFDKSLARYIGIGTAFIVLFFVFFSVNLKAQSAHNIDKRVAHLIDNGVQFDSLKLVIRDIIHTRDTAYLHNQLKKIIKVTSKNKDSKQYVFTLIGYGQLRDKKTIPFLNEAYTIAQKNNYTSMLGQILDTKVLVFKERAQNDSLLVSLLKAKDLHEKSGSKEALIPILHATADLYYSVKLYDQAQKIYREIIAKKGRLVEWNFWRHSVILNDLGLIEMKRGNYGDAIKYFNKSLKIIKADTSSSRYGIALAYNQLQLAKCYLKIQNNTLANHYYKQSIDNCLKHNMTDELMQLYTLKSDLLYSESKIDSSLAYTKKSFNLFNKEKRFKNNLLPIYTSFYKIFKNLGQYKKADSYLKLYTNLNDSINSNAQSVRNIQVLEENKYLKKAAKVNLLKTRNYTLLALVIFSFVIISIVYTNNIKLNKAYLKLVDKSLEAAHAPVNSAKNKEELTLNKTHNDVHAVKENFELVKKLKQFIEDDKVFLQNELSINDVAHHLNTNRTYLSRAINIVLKKSFTNYINDLRIKEAIRKISSQYFKQITIEGISEEVGFNNRVSFNAAFKKYTGILPSYFIKKISQRK